MRSPTWRPASSSTSSSFPPDARPPLDPTLQEAKRRQQEALLAAVAARAATWSEADRTVAAAVLDVLWSVASYERLVVDWQTRSPPRRPAASPG